MNDNQLVVLEFLKRQCGTEGNLMRAVHVLHNVSILQMDKKTIGDDMFYFHEHVRRSYMSLTRVQEAAILSAFAEWGLKQC